jgi:cytosine/adenosine deaminase-related metal-dependent hydrolase
MAIVLENACFINYQTLEFVQTNLVVGEGNGTNLLFYDNIVDFDDPHEHIRIDCYGKLVTKSFAVGHHHVYSALARGIPAPSPIPRNFHEKLQYLWWRLDKSLDKEMIKASAMATAIACAKAGATFVIDHHASPNHIHGSLDIIAAAFAKIGISHLLCYEITDRDGMEKAGQGLLETENYLKSNQGLVGLHASFTVGDSTMKKAVDLMEKYQSGIHIHVAEDAHDQADCKQNYGKRVIERFNHFGFLNSPKTILVHCLHLDKKERDMIRNSPAWVAQNTESNLNNKVGFFSSQGLGERIFLGTDGMHSDMVRSAQWAHFAGLHADPLAFGDTYYRLRNVHNYLKSNNFAGDGENNLVVLDYPSATPVTSENFLGHFLFGLNSGHVRHVISDGKLIVRDKVTVNIDEDDVLKFAKEQAVRLWKRFEGMGL